MILIDAVYINQSGGKILLEYFIKIIHEKDLIPNFVFLLDCRLDSPCLNKINQKQQFRISSSEGARRSFYKNLPDDISHVFCFANVPPPIKLKNRRVFILFHNALIISNKNMHYDLKTQIIFFFKKLYIKNRTLDTYKWIVQTRNMSRLLSQGLNVHQDLIEILPFYEEKRFEKLNQKLESNNGEFLYVADGVKQKNHQILLEAWEMIFDNNKLPLVLHLTIPPEFTLILNEIARLQRKGVLIINHGRCNIKEIEGLYKNCNYFIMPSLTESFGLPLIEAAEAGCEIIAADLEYVYDIIRPLAIFDPNNKQDIAETIVSVYHGNYNNKTQVIVKNKICNLINLIFNNV